MATRCGHRKEVEHALRVCPRPGFVPEAHSAEALRDQPMHLEEFGFNISAPHMHATCLSALGLKQGHRWDPAVLKKSLRHVRISIRQEDGAGRGNTSSTRSLLLLPLAKPLNHIIPQKANSTLYALTTSCIGMALSCIGMVQSCRLSRCGGITEFGESERFMTHIWP
jgi:hypothetical protein